MHGKAIARMNSLQRVKLNDQYLCISVCNVREVRVGIEAFNAGTWGNVLPIAMRRFHLAMLAMYRILANVGWDPTRETAHLSDQAVIDQLNVMAPAVLLKLARLLVGVHLFVKARMLLPR